MTFQPIPSSKTSGSQSVFHQHEMNLAPVHCSATKISHQQQSHRFANLNGYRIGSLFVTISLFWLGNLTNLCLDARAQTESNPAQIDLKSPLELSTQTQIPIDHTSANVSQMQSIDDGRKPLQVTAEDRSRDMRVKGIEQRIDILRDLIARQAAAEEARLAAETRERQSKDLTPESTSTQPSQYPSGKDSTSLPNPDSKVPAQPKVSELPRSKPINPSASDEPALGETTLENAASKGDSFPSGGSLETISSEASLNESNDWSGIPLTSSPINSLELANSLFRSGHYEQALKSYQDLLDRQPDEIDIAWLKLLAANCLRVLNDKSTAERLYREVTSLKEKSFAHDHARWYLNYVSKRKDLEAEWRAVENEIMSYQKSNK